MRIAVAYQPDLFQREMRRMRYAIAAFALGSVLSSAWPLFAAHHTAIISALVEQYGSQDIPPALLPFLSRETDSDIAYVIISLIRIASAAAFLLAMTSASRVVDEWRLVEELRRRSSLGRHWSWRWTILSCFVPVLNFIRPWLGFAELYRQALDFSLQTPSDDVRMLTRLTTARRHAGVISAVLAGMICFTTLVFIKSQIIYDTIADDIWVGRDPQPDYAFFLHWLILEAVSIGATGGMLYRYLRTLRLALITAERQTRLEIFD